MATDDDPTDVTLLTARTVEPGYEQDFRKWAGRVTSTVATFPGNLGNGVFQPPSTTGPWVLIHRFRNHETAQGWESSPERAALFDGCEGHHQTEVARRELSGMETWFTAPGDTATGPPPRWKMALVACVAAVPISLVGNGLLGPAIDALPLLARVLILALLFSTLMTYVMMPVATSVARRWLYPPAPGGSTGAGVIHPDGPRTAG